MNEDYTGQILGIYTILGLHDKRDTDGHALYTCKCNVCDKMFIRRLSEIKRTQQCKHINNRGDLIQYCLKWNNKRIRRIFNGMIKRCYNTNCADYQYYGYKGIKVCEQWLNNPSDFETWALLNGYNDTLTIDRIDETKDYCPENCRWISRNENTRRAGSVNWITIDDLTLTGRQWAEKLNIGVNMINRYIRLYGEASTAKLIQAMMINPPNQKSPPHNSTWFDVYHIEYIQN